MLSAVQTVVAHLPRTIIISKKQQRTERPFHNSQGTTVSDAPTDVLLKARRLQRRSYNYFVEG